MREHARLGTGRGVAETSVDHESAPGSGGRRRRPRPGSRRRADRARRAGHEPAAQPTSGARRRCTRPSSRRSTAPAPAGSNDWRGAGSITARAYQSWQLVTAETRMVWRKTADVCTLCVRMHVRDASARTARSCSSTAASRTAPGRGRRRAARGAVRARGPDPAGLPAEPAARADRLRGPGSRAARRCSSPGDHLCGHSYGGVISLLAAGRAAGGARAR